MPEIKRVRLANNATIEEQLHNCAIDLLPERLSRNSYVRWITEYDALVKQNDHRTSRRSDDDLLSHVTSSIVQERISFYFASIFHIGRMLQVSDFVMGNVRDSQKAENFKQLSLSLSEALTGEARGNKAAETLYTVITASGEHYSNQHTLALAWWEMWLKEVENLRDVIERRPPRYDRNELSMLTRTIRLPAHLKVRMQSEGVQFKAAPSPTGSLGSSSYDATTVSLMLLCIAEYGESGLSRHTTDAQSLWRDWLEIERARRNEPHEQIVLNQLKSKYGKHNPFDEFRPGAQPASWKLRELLKENTLPDGKASPWKRMWERSLEKMPWGDMPLVDFGDFSSTLAVNQADSVIKTESAEDMLPTESWASFIQRLFEENWIKDVGRRAGATNKSAGGAIVWTVDDFVTFIDRVVFALNELGYALQCPSLDRLKTLLDKASGGEYLHGKNFW